MGAHIICIDPCHMEHHFQDHFPPSGEPSSAHLGQFGHFGTTFFNPIVVSDSYKSQGLI